MDATRTRGRAGHIVLWVLQIVLALLFLRHAYGRIVDPVGLIDRQPWAADVALSVLRLIGIAELAGAIGLVLPAATRILPWLTPLAAVGLIVTMLGAIAFHVSRSDWRHLSLPVVYAVLAAVVAWGRFRWRPIPPRGS